MQEKKSNNHFEKLKNIASDHLFMHGVQINDWKNEGPKIFVNGEGSWVTDIEGNKYLDMMGGLWYKSAGYGRKKIADAVYKQMTEISSPPANSTTESTILLSGKISEIYSDKNCRTFFVSGGSEAVETAVKMAKKYQINSGKPRAYKVISRRNSYHGSTAMAVSLGRTFTADPMGPEMIGNIHVANYNAYRPPIPGKPTPEDISEWLINELEHVIIQNDPDTVAAIIAEPVSASNGIHVPPKSYWEGLRRIADEYQVVLISDEVINGFGRLGEWFGAQCFGVQPDITTVAKGITSGYAPLGAVIATKKIADSFLGGQKEMFYHLITFGGHPISTAAANANIEIFEEENLVENSKLMGNYLFEKLQELLKYSIVGDVRGGLGLLAAVEIVKDKESKEKFPIEMQLMKKITNNLFSNGIVSFRAGDVISICPPLSINKSEIDFMVEGINASIKTFSDSL